MNEENSTHTSLDFLLNQLQISATKETPVDAHSNENRSRNTSRESRRTSTTVTLHTPSPKTCGVLNFHQSRRPVRERFDACVKRSQSLKIGCDFEEKLDHETKHQRIARCKSDSLRSALSEDCQSFTKFNTPEATTNAVKVTATEVHQISESERIRAMYCGIKTAVTAVIPKHTKKVKKKKAHKCKFCGYYHVLGKVHCPAAGRHCNKCNRFNHFAAACKKKTRSGREIKPVNHKKNISKQGKKTPPKTATRTSLLSKSTQDKKAAPKAAAHTQPFSMRADNMYLKKCLIFEKESSALDEIGFLPHIFAVEDRHKRRQKHTHYPYVINPKSYVALMTMPSSGREIFTRELLEQFDKLRDQHEVMVKHTNEFFNIDTKISIQLGFNYFFSSLFQFEKVLTIEEFKYLNLNHVSNTDIRYYKAIESVHNTSSKHVDYNFGTLKSSFTHQIGMRHVADFETSLFDMGYELMTEPNVVSYKMLVNYRQSLIEKLVIKKRMCFDNTDAERVVEQMKKASKLELKFNDAFKLQCVVFKLLQNHDMYSSNIDVLRSSASDPSGKARITNNTVPLLLDVRYQVQQFCKIDSQSFKDFHLIQDLFDGFLRPDASNKFNLIVNCEPAEIDFLRKEDAIRYECSESEILSNSQVTINDNIGYRVPKSLMQDESIVLQHDEWANNFIESSVDLKDIINKTSDGVGEAIELKLQFIDELWNFGLYLSNSASECL